MSIGGTTPTNKQTQNKMQKLSFPDGGFVIHKISHLSAKRISAWFDKSGKPLAAEYMPCARSVAKNHKNIWMSLESMGRAWRV